uniref:Uncharacterized protein n=1 Tax=Trichogramma kaykai TaxID=54128 RepID=A0ABD2WWM5_9HYME
MFCHYKTIWQPGPKIPMKSKLKICIQIKILRYFRVVLSLKLIEEMHFSTKASNCTYKIIHTLLDTEQLVS